MTPNNQVTLWKQIHIWVFVSCMTTGASSRGRDRAPPHVVVDVSERQLRLNHPELRQVARRVAVLRAERGAEGVDVAHPARESLHLQHPTKHPVR